MNNKYRELKERQQKEVNDFPIFFAFNNEQFGKGMEKLGLKPTDTQLIYRLGAGGFYKKTDSKALHDLFDKHTKELRQGFEDKQFIYDAFDYELGNHEYCITRDITDTLCALGLSRKEVAENETMKRIIKEICNEQVDWYCEHG